MRGFETNGMGPVQAGEHLGGKAYAVAKFEAEFPLGLPEEFGITGGAFYDVGAIWNVDSVVPPAVQSSELRAAPCDRAVAVLGIALSARSAWISPRAGERAGRYRA